MHPLSEPELLALLDRGSTLHPIDRTLLLYGRLVESGDDQAADLPIGQVNVGLIRFYRRAIAHAITAHSSCTCGETMVTEIALDPILERAPAEPGVREGAADGIRFRLPTHRDLAGVAPLPNPDQRVTALLERCCFSQDDPGRAGLLQGIEAAMEQLDPLADIEVAITCGACSAVSTLCLDIGALIWDRLAGTGRALIGEVHRLAGAYGWSESEILALGSERRAAYLEWIVA